MRIFGLVLPIVFLYLSLSLLSAYSDLAGSSHILELGHSKLYFGHVVVNRVSKTKHNKYAICILYSSSDPNPMRGSLANLDTFLSDDLKDIANIILFHNGYQDANDIINIRQSFLNLTIVFVNIDGCFSRPLLDESSRLIVDPYASDPHWRKGSKWGYHNMIRFFFVDIFHILHGSGYTEYMRLDDSSRFSYTVPNVFSIMASTKVYIHIIHTIKLYLCLLFTVSYKLYIHIYA